MDTPTKSFAGLPEGNKDEARLRQSWEASQLMTTNPKTFEEWLSSATPATSGAPEHG